VRPKIGTYLEQQILSASPLELVVLSYRTATQAVRDARRFLAEKNIRQRVRSINLAHAVLGELYRALDSAAGGDIAAELGRLYDYMMRKLLEANFHQSDAPLAEVLTLLCELMEAWEKIAAGAVPTVTPAAPTTAQPWKMNDVPVEQGAYSVCF
jgi:flagellar secretion chaperone FliS